MLEKGEKMPTVQTSDPTIGDVVRTLWRYRLRCGATAVAVAGLVVAFVMLSSRTWEASQAILIRNEASANLDSPGRFRLDDEMKAAQETVLELALSRTVLRNALCKIGPAADCEAPESWPTEEAVEDLRSAISIDPPRGAEFGKTEIFYLKTRQKDRELAVKLVEAVFDELQTAFGHLRAASAESARLELTKTVALAQEDLAQATGQLARIENEAGVDLIALRMLHTSPTGESDLYRTLVNSLDELRQAETAENTNGVLLELVEQAKKDPAKLLAAPPELLALDPVLARLSQGLSESILRAAHLSSTMTEEHPLLVAASHEVANVRQDIFRELDAATEGVKAAALLAAARRETLQSRVDQLRARVDRLTQLRAEYSQLAAQVEHRRTLLEEAQSKLGQVCAAEAAATASSLLTRVDRPDGGTHPVGPSRAMLVLLGLVGGLVAGAGVVFLTAPIDRRPAISAHASVYRETMPVDDQPVSRAHWSVSSGVDSHGPLHAVPSQQARIRTR